VSRLPRSFVQRARGFRPVLLGVLLFWACVFAAFAAPCTWTVTSGTGTGSGDVGYVYPGWQQDDFCAGRHNGGSGIVWHPSTTCSQTGSIASVSFTLNAIGDPNVGTYEVTGSGSECLGLGGGPGPDPESVVWTEAQWLQVIFGGIAFFALMHGFVAGRTSA